MNRKNIIIMCIQTSDILEYRNNKYYINTYPLEDYLANKPSIHFSSETSINWKGYTGVWLITNNKIYLKEIQSTKYSLYDIFNTNEPVHANWYNGDIEIGIGNLDQNTNIYDYYLIITIQNGKILKRNIIKKYEKYEYFTFGKYKNRNFHEVVFGKIKDDSKQTIYLFLKSLLQYLIMKDYEFQIKTPRFEILEKDITLIKTARDNNIKYILGKNYIAINMDIQPSDDVLCDIINMDTLKIASNLSLILEKILSSDFNRLITLTKEEFIENVISEDTFLINGDIKYINWAIKNVDFFTIPPNQLLGTYKLYKLKSFKIKRLNQEIFEFIPIIEKIDYHFDSNIIKLNQEKFEKKNNVRYDKQTKTYIPNFTKDHFIRKFGYYLNENCEKSSSTPFTKNICENTEDIYEENIFEEDVFEKYIYEEKYNQNNWLQDAAGTSDPEVMNDTWWNID